MDTAESSSSKKAPRRYAFACSNCRKKKIRCDGQSPECGSCMRAEEVCQYPKKRMEAQLAQAQKRIQELESELQTARSNSPYGSQTASSPSALYSDSEMDHSLYSQVGYDAQGSLTYHGPTSRYSESALDESVEQGSKAAVLREQLRESARAAFATNREYLQTVWIPSLSSKTNADFGLPVDVANHLLAAFFKWHNSTVNFIYEPVFMRDLALNGPYCSRFLLTSIFSYAARHCAHDSPVYQDRGERCFSVAKEMLMTELSGSKPTIPTIQGLLILGYRQAVIGNTSEGWLFSGMAFRMMTDIGLHLDPQRLSRYENIDSLEIELRKRLALSAYSWDRVLSLALGRSPTIPRLPICADDIFDDTDDLDSWKPLECEGAQDHQAVRSYPTSTFRQLSKLSEVSTLVISAVTAPNRDRLTSGHIEALQNRLEAWFEQLPSALRVDDSRQRPPRLTPHILILNLSYRTLLLVLFRRYLSPDSEASSALEQHRLQVLADHANRVHDLVVLFFRMFRGKGITYWITYCIYTAAIVDVGFIRTGGDDQRHAAAQRLKAAVKILENEAKQNPGILQTIENIKKQVQGAAAEREQRSQGKRPSLGSRQASSSSSTHAQTSASAPSTYAPQYHSSSFGGMVDTSSLWPHNQSVPAFGGIDSLNAVPHALQMTDWNAYMYQNNQGFDAHSEASGWANTFPVMGWPPTTSMP